MPVRHADDGAPAGLEHARHLLDGALGFVEVLDRAHRVDRVEARVAEGQIAHVADGALQAMPRAGPVSNAARA